MARRKDGPPPIRTTLGALPDSEGRKVLYAEMVIRKTGDGLSDALKADPIALDYGQEVFVLVKARVRKIEHDQIDPKDPETFLKRIHKLDAADAVIVDHETGEGLYTELAEEKERKIEKARGIERLDFGDEDEGASADTP